MTDDVFKGLRRQQEWINGFLEPSRRMQEEILRSLAPVKQLEESLRMVTDNLVSQGVTGDILRSMEEIGRVELADFGSIAALTATERDLAGVTDAIKQQSRWIEEASGLSFGKDKWILADFGALARSSKAVTGAFSVVAVTKKPTGVASTWSPWLIQIVSTGSRPRKKLALADQSAGPGLGRLIPSKIRSRSASTRSGQAPSSR